MKVSVSPISGSVIEYWADVAPVDSLDQVPLHEAEKVELKAALQEWHPGIETRFRTFYVARFRSPISLQTEAGVPVIVLPDTLHPVYCAITICGLIGLTRNFGVSAIEGVAAAICQKIAPIGIALYEKQDEPEALWILWVTD